MTISEKCNCCTHEPICAFKGEYLAACKAIKEACYGTGSAGFMPIKDSKVNVSIRCPYIMTQNAARRADNGTD